MSAQSQLSGCLCWWARKFPMCYMVGEEIMKLIVNFWGHLHVTLGQQAKTES